MEIKMKIKLGSRPKSFPRVVKFTDVDGTEMTAPVTYKYRTRKEFAAFIDGLVEAAGIQPALGAEGEKITMTALLEKSAGSNAEYLMQVLDGWGLDEDFTRANVQQLVDEMPGAANAIMEEYRAAITEGRLGN
jgi:hypothetical protein